MTETKEATRTPRMGDVFTVTVGPYKIYGAKVEAVFENGIVFSYPMPYREGVKVNRDAMMQWKGGPQYTTKLFEGYINAPAVLERLEGRGDLGWIGRAHWGDLFTE